MVVKDGNIPSEEVGLPSVVDETVAKGKQSSLVDTTSLGSYPPLPMQGTTAAGNTPGKSSYANVTSKPSGTKVNFHNLFTPGGNVIDVVIPVESIRAISERFANTAYGFFLGKRVAYPIVASYVMNTWVATGCQPIKEDVGTVPIWVKLYGVPVTAFSEDGLSVIATKLGASETKNLKKTSQTPKGILVGQKVGFKPTKQLYQPVSKTPTINTSGIKKNNVVPTKEVGKSNPFEVLTSVKNDVEFGTNGVTSNLASQEANTSGSSFWNVNSNSPSTTPIIEKIDKIKKMIIDGKVTLVDDDGKPLENVVSSGDYESEDEVASVDNEMSSFLAKKDGYGTQSLLEQRKESYENDDYEYDLYDDDMYESQKIPDNDYEYDPYDDDMYESQKIPELQAICDNLDIRVRGSGLPMKRAEIFSDNLVMAVPNLDELGYTKEIIQVEYEWKPPRCTTKKKKSGGNNGGTKNLKPVLVKQKTICYPKANQPTKEAILKTAPSTTKKKVSTTCHSSRKTGKMNASTSGNGTFSLSNSFEALNVDNAVTEEVDSGAAGGECVLLDDEGKPLENIDYTGDHDSEDEVEPVDNEIASFLASKPSGVSYGTNSLLEQWRETYRNNNYDYDPYDDNMYEG
ncbi:hypothetical protein Tco_0503340 [Tanacetum coccineum]